MLVDTKEFFKCETCRHCRSGKCTAVECDAAEMYSPDVTKLAPAVSKTQSFKPEFDSFKNWLVYTAIGENYHLLQQMNRNSDGTYPIYFEVGGFQLDFDKVSDVISKRIDELVAMKAQELLAKQYEDLSLEIDEIRGRILNQRKLFKYDWEW